MWRYSIQWWSFSVSIHSYQSAEVQTWRRLCSESPFILISLLRCKLEGVCVQSLHSYTSICWGADLNASVFRVSIHTYQSAEVQTWRHLRSESPFIHINLLRCKLECIGVQSFHSYLSVCWGANLKASVFRVSIHSYLSAEVQTWRRLCSEFPFIHINLLRCSLEGVGVQSFHSFISICWGANLNASVFRVSIHTYQSAEGQTSMCLCSESPFIHINLLRCKLECIGVQSFHSYLSVCWCANLEALV